jgi:glycine cleavage system H protein
MTPKDRKYSQEHEWIMIEPQSNIGVVGITDYAQDKLGDVVFISIPPPDTHLDQSQKLGEIESVKTVSDLFAPISGRVLEVNPSITSQPELINQDPYGQGWLLKMTLDKADEFENLLTSDEYDAMLGQQP